ncbi:MAG TPA: hypothetical protein VMT05_10770 [Terriglobales bacterium]|nr:hypothetical protein [Terriglobales bacterium]
MAPASKTLTRRSTRVSARIPVLLTSLSPTTPFSLFCETLLVNAHGCAAKLPQPVSVGMPVRLQIRESREVTGRIVVCQPIAGGQPSWVAAIELDKPGNVWGVTPVPEDWRKFDQDTEESGGGEAAAHQPAIELKMPVWPLASPSAKTGLPAKAHEELEMQLAAQQEAIARLEERLATSLAAAPGATTQQLADVQQETLAQARQQFDATLAELLPQQSAAQMERIARLEEQLTTSLAAMPGAIRQQLADVQQETLAQARKQSDAMLAELLPQQSAEQTERIARLEERLTTSLAAMPGVIGQQLADAQRDTLAQARKQSDAVLGELLPQQSAAQSEAIARLQERMAAVESLPSVVRQQLSETREQTQTQVREQLGAFLAELLQPLQEELGVCRKKAEEAQQVRAAVAEQLEQLPRKIQEHIPAALQPIQERVRAELERILAETRSRGEQEASRLQALEVSTQALQKELDKAMVALQSSPREPLGRPDALKPELAAQRETIARIEQRLASVESLPTALGEQLSQAQRQMMARVHDQVEAALAHSVGQLREELAVCRKNAQDGQQIRAAVAEQLEGLFWQVQQHVETAFEPHLERARAEMQRIIAEARPRSEQEAARLQGLEASAQALQKELGQARELLESSTRNLPQRIQEPIAAAVQEAMARARAEVSADLARELETVQQRGRMAADEMRGVTDSLRHEREAAMAQLVAVEAKREELQRWLAEQQANYAQQVERQLAQLTEQQTAHTNDVRHKLEQLANELAERSSRMLEEQIRSDVEKRAEHAQADLQQRLGPMLERGSDLRREVLSLLGTLQKEHERCQTEMRALLEEKDNLDNWIQGQAADFQRTFHDALVETTGQIRGRLQMAVEMMEQPLAKLRDQAAEQLQEQAGRQARHLREHGDETAERLRGLQRDIETAVRESLRAQAAETAAACGREIAEAAQRSVEEWRSALARNLDSITSLLVQRFPGDKK